MDKRIILGGLLALVAAGCSTLSDPNTQVATVQSTFAGYLAAEAGYLASPKPDAKIVRALENARMGVQVVLNPLAAQAAAGQLPTSVQMLDVQTALSAMQAALEANGLLGKGASANPITDTTGPKAQP